MAYGRFDIEREWIDKEYWENKRTLMDLADEVGCSYVTVYNAMEHFGIPRRRPGQVSQNPEDTLLENLEITSPDRCWEWKGVKNAGGYGVVSSGGGRWMAHRLVYELFVEEIPEGMCVLHCCDNPACCNPDHLFIGTVADNNRDRDEKGRTATGLDLPQTKLSDADILAIKYRRLNGGKVVDIANDLDVDHSTVTRVATGKRDGPGPIVTGNVLHGVTATFGDGLVVELTR